MNGEQERDTRADLDKIRVMLCDDSAVVRGLISRTLREDPDIAIVASVQNGKIALGTLPRVRPDVLLLDIEMPEMDGMTALPQLLALDPRLKIIMCSTLTKKGAKITMQALQMGAVECLAKPTSAGERGAGSDFQDQLLRLVKSLGPDSYTRARRFREAGSPDSGLRAHTSTIPAASSMTSSTASGRETKQFSLRHDKDSWKSKPTLLAIGSSTGGPQALFQVMKSCTGFDIPIVITQHMPATFTKILAQHIAQQSGVPCVEGQNGMRLEKGHAYVAPGGFHMVFEGTPDQTRIRLSDSAPENFCRPSVDPMLRSAVAIHGRKVLAAILTGMGQDGLKGSESLVACGGRVIAQDEKTSVVWGMPGAVAMAGLCSEVLPLPEIGSWLRAAVLQSAR